MAGWWSKIPDSGSGSLSVLDCLKTLQKAQTKELLLNLKLSSKGSAKSYETDKLRHVFNQLVSSFLSDICGSHFRPSPPMLGNGQAVDLLKLYLVVREKGGFESVSRNGLWELVARESGFESSLSTGLKLVYVKYLDMLDTWFGKLVKETSSKGGLSSVKLESEINDVYLKISDVKKEDDKCVPMELEEETEKLYRSNEIQSCVESNGGKDCSSDKDDNMGYESSVVKEDKTSRKRKRECQLALLDWVRKVAKDPCDPVIGSLPERFKWKSYGSENLWKQVLLAREAMLLKRTADSNAVQSIWQIKQKMHPTMYGDQSGSERARCSQRLISAKESRSVLSFRKSQARDCSESSSSGAQSDLGDQSDTLAEDSFWVNNIRRKKIPLGPYFQAKVPEWTGEISQSDQKWLGTRVWPLEKGEPNRNLIERDPIGKGRQDSCGCQFPRSQECVRFHVAEKRNKVRLELGSAFKQWKLDKIGEEVSLSWTPQEEKTFRDIVKCNPASLENCFWNEITKYFHNKSREVLVSYYFNVYLLCRRAHQNRSSSSNIDSDDDELEKNGVEHEVSKRPGSIFCSPKKVHLNAR